MRVHLYDFRWTDPETCEFQASHEGRFGRKPFGRNAQLSLEIVSQTHCGGSMRDNVWKKCPHEVPGKKRCEYCRSREGNFIFTAFDGFDQSNVTAEDLDRIGGEHVVYLAWFAPDVIKVGVSKLERQTMRQLEQGAYATLFFAQTPDGVSARQLETLFRRSGLIDKVKMSQKKSGLLPFVESSEVQAQLLSVLAEHRSCLSGSEKHLQSFLLDDPIFQNWSDIYGLDLVEQSDKPFHVVDLGIGNWVSGKVVAVRGAFLILETDEEMVACNTKDLLGREIEFAPKPLGLKVSSALQGALF